MKKIKTSGSGWLSSNNNNTFEIRYNGKIELFNNKKNAKLFYKSIKTNKSIFNITHGFLIDSTIYI